MKVRCEIEYTNKVGMSIHSYLEPKDCLFENIDKLDKEILHIALDEWLTNSNGTGIFYIKEDK